MSRRASLFITKRFKQRGIPKPTSFTLAETAELMEAYWQKLREGEHAASMAKSNKAVEQVLAFLRTKKSKRKSK